MNPKLKLLLATLPLLVSLIVVGRGMPNFEAEAESPYSCAIFTQSGWKKNMIK